MNIKNKNKNKKIAINKKEVLRYLGYKDQVLTEKLEHKIDQAILKTQELSKSLVVFKVFKIFKNAEQSIKLADSDLVLRGKSINKYLKGAQAVAVLAATLGVDIDNAIRIKQKEELSQALILDACATTAIESLCDETMADIAAIACKNNYNIKNRFSPGYGDFDLDIQNKLLKVLNAQKTIGLTVNERDILLPRKSVTAIIGFYKKDIQEHNLNQKSCRDCNMYKTCSYKK